MSEASCKTHARDRRPRLKLLCAALAAGLLNDGAAFAQSTLFWTGGANGDMSSSGAWGGRDPTNNHLVFAGASPNVAFASTDVLPRSILVTRDGYVLQGPGALVLQGEAGISGTVTITTAVSLAVRNGVLPIFGGGLISGPLGDGNGAATNNWGLAKDGVGTLTLTGDNTYALGTLVRQGTLRINSERALGTGLLTLDGGTLQLMTPFELTRNIALRSFGGTIDVQDLDITMSGTMSGPGGLTKIGNGTLTLLGAHTYTGSTTVTAGTLTVNGSLASTVSVGTPTLTIPGTSIPRVPPLATLQGTGTIISLGVSHGGTLSPGGNAIGTFNVRDRVIFSPGSTYVVDVNAAGESDRTDSTFTATIFSGTVNVRAVPGRYKPSTTYTILTASSGRSGEFTNVTSNFAFLTPRLTYDANNVYLVLTLLSDLVPADFGVDTTTAAATTAAATTAAPAPLFARVAQTPNQRAISTVLDRNFAGASGDFGIIIDTLLSASAQEARAAYEQLSGVSHAGVPGAARTQMTSFGRLLASRASSVQHGGGSTGLSFSNVTLASNDLAPVRSDVVAQAGVASGVTPGTRMDDPARGFWIRGQGLDSRYNGDGNAPGHSLRSSGAAMGLDSKFGEDLVLGIAGSYDRGTVGASGSSDSARVRDTKVGVYGNWRVGRWSFSGLANYGTDEVNSRRAITFGGLSRSADASYRMRQWYASGEAAYRIPLGAATVAPLAGLEFSSLRQAAFTETGAGAANLAVDGRTTESVASNLGVRFERAFDPQEPGAGSFELRAIWRHEFRDVNPTFSARMTGAPTAVSFTVAGASLQRDSLVAGGGASGKIAKDISLYGDYNLELRGSQRTHAVVGGLRYSF